MVDHFKVLQSGVEIFAVCFIMVTMELGKEMLHFNAERLKMVRLALSVLQQILQGL